jgi:hypothetical protein
MTITLMIVAPMDNRITNLEKDLCWLKAMRFAIKLATFNRHGFSAQK